MKPAFESVAASKNNSYIIRMFEEKTFSAPYHFHPEYEFTLIVSGTGKRYVGANMSDFTEGDLVLLGPHLPHCWKTEQKRNMKKSCSVVLQFQHEFLGEAFFEKPELKQVMQLLRNSQQGMHFTGDIKMYQTQMLQLLKEKNKLKKLLLMLEILYRLSEDKHYRLLDKQTDHATLSKPEMNRIHATMAYIVENFRDAVSLNEAAAQVYMTPHAFCKYFKKITRKTFIEAVTDYRIDFALQQLVNTDKAISEIAYNSGFNDISNFHKTFKQRNNTSPLSYRNEFIKKLS